MIHTSARWAENGLKIFWKHRAGAVALEFAILVPLFIAGIFGEYELTDKLVATERLDNISSGIGNLLTTYSSISASELDDLMTLPPVILGPYSSASTPVRITSLTPVNPTGAVTGAKVAWCHTNSSELPCEANGTSIQTAADGAAINLKLFASSSTNIVLVEIKYTYKSPTGVFIREPVTSYSSFGSAPRTTNAIACPDC